jgi:hypothetical protein
MIRKLIKAMLCPIKKEPVIRLVVGPEECAKAFRRVTTSRPIPLAKNFKCPRCEQYTLVRPYFGGEEIPPCSNCDHVIEVPESQFEVLDE